MVDDLTRFANPKKDTTRDGYLKDICQAFTALNPERMYLFLKGSQGLWRKTSVQVPDQSGEGSQYKDEIMWYEEDADTVASNNSLFGSSRCRW